MANRESPMNYEAYKSIVHSANDPAGLHHLLQALVLDARDSWDEAHIIAQEDSSNDGSWVHAYLHRKEGDRWNASYWYNRASKPYPDISLEDEWEALSCYLLEKHS